VTHIDDKLYNPIKIYYVIIITAKDKKYISVAHKETLTTNILIPTGNEPKDNTVPKPLTIHLYNISCNLKTPPGAVIDKRLENSLLRNNVAYAQPTNTIDHDKIAVTNASGGNVFLENSFS